jgi:hypothetical protein
MENTYNYNSINQGVRQILTKGHTPYECTISYVYKHNLLYNKEITIICTFSQISLSLIYNTYVD